MEKVIYVAHIRYVSSRNGRLQTKRITSNSRRRLLCSVENYINTSSCVAYVKQIEYIDIHRFPAVPYSQIKQRSFDELPEFYDDLPW